MKNTHIDILLNLIIAGYILNSHSAFLAAIYTCSYLFVTVITLICIKEMDLTLMSRTLTVLKEAMTFVTALVISNIVSQSLNVTAGTFKMSAKIDNLANEHCTELSKFELLIGPVDCIAPTEGKMMVHDALSAAANDPFNMHPLMTAGIIYISGKVIMLIISIVKNR